MVKQIFIGGVRRSGTTILGRILSLHNEIFIYPFETRFIIDPDGIIDLCNNLSKNWSPDRGDLSIKRFIAFMERLYPSQPSHLIRMGILFFIKKFNINLSPLKYTSVMAKQWKDEEYFTYLKPPFSVFIKKEKYFNILKNFINQIEFKEFNGYWTGMDSLTINPKIAVSKKFDENEICKLSGKYVDELLSIPLIKYKKKIWGDHTPLNILFSNYLIKMFPEAKIIHIYRDFRDVVCSYKTKRWGARTTEDAVYAIKNILEKWDEIKKKLPSEKYIEISLEKLVSKPNNILKEICNFLNIDFDRNMLKVDLSRSHKGRWKKELSKKDLEIIEENLGRYLERYEYE